MEYPIKVALVRAVPVLPDGASWWFEPKFDGHRTVLRRTEDAMILYARSGRIVALLRIRCPPIPHCRSRALARRHRARRIFV